jgi:CMP/dCMP kinase
MSSRTIAISRSLGAAGEEVGRKVSEALGFRYVDDEIVRRAAEAAGVSPETVQQAEQTPSLIRRILELMAAAPPAEPAVWPTEFAYQPAAGSYYPELIQQVIRETAAKGDVVILAHGASIPLAERDDVLRVFVTASAEARARRVSSETDVDLERAKKAVEDSDRQREQYFRRFYRISQELPTHYDLVLNTDRLTTEQAAQLVLLAAKQ